jgi:hypothetical protein
LPKAKAKGKTLCSEGFEPSERLMALGQLEGLDPPAILRARDEMVSWSRGNGEKRLDWDAVFANWLRRNATKARAGPPARAGNRTGYNGKETLGDILRATQQEIERLEYGDHTDAVDKNGPVPSRRGPHRLDLDKDADIVPRSSH